MHSDNTKGQLFNFGNNIFLILCFIFCSKSTNSSSIQGSVHRNIAAFIFPEGTRHNGGLWNQSLLLGKNRRCGRCLKYCCSYQAALDSRQSAGSASQWRWAEWERCHTAHRLLGGSGKCDSISAAGHSPPRPQGSHTNVGVSHALQPKTHTHTNMV